MNKLEQFTPDGRDASDFKKAYYKANPIEEYWRNDIYQVNVRRHQPTNQDGLFMVHLSIKRMDTEAGMDWRHMQEMKNQLVGVNNEGMEMYPAEERLIDGANQYHMWVFEDPEYRWPWGFQERLVSEDESQGNVQRKFENPPADMEECTQKLLKAYKEFVK